MSGVYTPVHPAFHDAIRDMPLSWGDSVVTERIGGVLIWQCRQGWKYQMHVELRLSGLTGIPGEHYRTSLMDFPYCCCFTTKISMAEKMQERWRSLSFEKS
eukprot:GFKZ01004451.1.p1 GENE.GFKZ01004451.1~~GFKZ01004451.1.p1  ORF type:complete len:101 (+),score=0.42 GFKZ01004451.1:89-391(+)